MKIPYFEVLRLAWGKRRKGTRPSEIIGGTGTFIFLVIVLLIALGLVITFTDKGHTLTCDVLRQLTSQGLKFIIDTSALGCQ